MSGSAITVPLAAARGLLDELNLLVHPIAVGDGLARLIAAQPARISSPEPSTCCVSAGSPW
jgi:hypothetical protein